MLRPSRSPRKIRVSHVYVANEEITFLRGLDFQKKQEHCHRKFEMSRTSSRVSFLLVANSENLNCKVPPGRKEGSCFAHAEAKEASREACSAVRGVQASSTVFQKYRVAVQLSTVSSSAKCPSFSSEVQTRSLNENMDSVSDKSGKF